MRASSTVTVKFYSPWRMRAIVWTILIIVLSIVVMIALSFNPAFH